MTTEKETYPPDYEYLQHRVKQLKEERDCFAAGLAELGVDLDKWL